MAEISDLIDDSADQNLEKKQKEKDDYEMDQYEEQDDYEVVRQEE